MINDMTLEKLRTLEELRPYHNEYTKKVANKESKSAANKRYYEKNNKKKEEALNIW